MAVIVSTPARAVISSLNLDNRNRRRPIKEKQILLATRVPEKNEQENVAVLEVISEDAAIPDSIYDNASPDTNIIQGSSDLLDDGSNIRRLDEIILDPASSSGDLERGTRSSSSSSSTDGKVVQANSLTSNQQTEKDAPAPPPRRRPFEFFTSLLRNRSNRRRPDGQPQQSEREKNVFERNFENSKTQASIQKLGKRWQSNFCIIFVA